jgi:radical SAM protein with 4Fe4S-binding SPASM domain
MCAKHGITSNVSLTTNGVLNKEKVDYLVKNIQGVSISFDGLPDIQNNNRPLCNDTGSFDAVDQAIKQFDAHHYPYAIRSTVSEEHFNRMKEMADFIFNRYSGIKLWDVSPVLKVGRAVNMCFDNNIDFCKYYIELENYVHEKYPDKKVTNVVFSYKITDAFCPTVNNTGVWLDAYGNLTSCHERNTDNDTKLGFIENNQVMINKDFNKEALKYYIDNKDNVCKNNCFAFYHCAGGCPMRMQRDEHGTFLDNTSYAMCDMVKKYWKHMILTLISTGKSIDMTAKICLEHSENIPEYCTMYTIDEHDKIDIKSRNIKNEEVQVV